MSVFHLSGSRDHICSSQSKRPNFPARSAAASPAYINVFPAISLGYSFSSSVNSI
jgi:hypothetical protein